jgi:hypothetical protein
VERDSLTRLQVWVEAEGFKGYDPYDALNSPLLAGLSLGNKYLRIAFIQTLKRLPVNLRPLLLVRQDYNPKGLGLFLWGYAKLYAQAKNPHYLEQIDRLLDMLEECKSGMNMDSRPPIAVGGRLRGDDRAGHGWGYNFDWQSRAFFIPKFTPTVVNSAFIGHALLDTWEMTGNRRALDMALPIADFIMKDLNRFEEDGTLCFSYTPLDRYFVHNANLLGASLLIRLHVHRKEATLREAALTALAYSMQHQRDDGAWFYAEKESSRWIDSFHTGSNLQAIRYFLEAGFGEEWRERYEKGVQFYRDRFFLADGTPKYYPDRTWPIDIHAPAQAVVFFSGMGPEYAELTGRILGWMLANMQDPAGYFYFQKHRHYTNRIPYMRWGQAWAFHALTEYFLHDQK